MRRSNARVAPAPEADDRPDIDKVKKEMDNSIKLKFRPNQPLRSTNLFSRNQKQSHLAKSSIFVIGIAALVFVSCGYFYLNSCTPTEKRYQAVIDGGSTGSRIHVFEYMIKDGAPIFDFSAKKGLGSMRVTPGLSAFADDPKGAAESMLKLMEFARKKIPGDKWAETEIRLMATAGLRMLDLSVQARILESCRTVFSTSGFAFHNDWASVISGSDEGVYAWVVANYALGTLGGDPQETTGIIELGGASAQVTFFSNEPIPPEFLRTVKFGNVSYSLYSHSLLEFGQNVAYDLVRGSNLKSQSLVDPCSPKGYKHNVMIGQNMTPSSLVQTNDQSSILQSSGNFTECRSASYNLLQKGKEDCLFDNCAIGSTFIPKLRGKFIATENFFHTSKFFGLSQRRFLSELVVAGKEFCGSDWSNLKVKYPGMNDEDLHKYCFSSAYIIAFLHDSLGIALDDKRIGFASEVNDIPLDWALGAFIFQIMTDLDLAKLYPINSILDFATLGGLIFVILLLFGAYFVSKWKKPHIKTIYDLEKGKYIVTRVVGRHS